jgi:hypothetical protein
VLGSWTHADQGCVGDEGGIDWKGQVSDKDVDDHPTNRAGRPKDIADAALYLIDAGFITGMSNVLEAYTGANFDSRPGPNRRRRGPAEEKLGERTRSWEWTCAEYVHSLGRRRLMSAPKMKEESPRCRA